MIMTDSKNDTSETPEHLPERRDFLKQAASIVLGGVTGLVPLAAGLAVFTDPLRHKATAASLSRVASLDSIPDDGVPRKFTVEANQTDAWNRFPQTPIGAVYLRRSGDKKVQALNVVCPHAGCFVDLDPSKKSYFCPCHRSTFSLDGHVVDPKSPSPRGMDELEVEVRNDSEVWVRFQNFVAGHKEKIPAV
jgi:menaquinol-cytochrome c reductase iron-sulfur subunit